MDYEKLTDEELIESYKAGDREAIDVILRRYTGLATSISRQYFLAGNEEDLRQEGIIGLSRAVMSYDRTKNDSFLHYAKICIKRSILTAIRAMSTVEGKAFSNHVELNDIPTNEITLPSLEDVFILEETAKARREELFSVLNQPQQLLLNYYLQGYSYVEIAKLMNKDVKYVDNTLQQVKRKLRKHLSK